MIYSPDGDRCPQHSDLAINNFGRTASGFVIFDWEDYGAVNLPGFDFVVLLASGYQFEAGRIRLFFERAAGGGNIESAFSTDLMNNLNLRSDDWVDLFLVNLILFHELKTRLDYGPGVIDRTLRLIKDLADSRKAVPGN